MTLTTLCERKLGFVSRQSEACERNILSSLVRTFFPSDANERLENSRNYICAIGLARGLLKISDYIR